MPRQKQNGMTLLEAVIYIALFSVIASFVLAVFNQLIAGYGQNRDRIEVDAEADFIMQKIAWALTGAQSINQPAVNATSSVLSVAKYNYGRNPIVFDLVSSNVRISEGGGTPVVLESGRVRVSQLVFAHLPAVQSAPEAAQVILTVAPSGVAKSAASTTLRGVFYLND